MVLPAAGLGSRMKSDVRKPLLRIDGRPILDRTIERFLATPGCAEIVVVVHPDDYADREFTRRLRADFGISKVVPGGTVRRVSVLAGLEATDSSLGIVLIHDAVRPNVRSQVILQVVEAASRHGAAIAAVPATETVKVVNDASQVLSTPRRSELWFARTPQGFRREIILSAHRKAEADDYPCTDDAQLVEWQGGEVVVVMDDYENIKITTPSDLALARAIHRARAVGKRSDSVEG